MPHEPVRPASLRRQDQAFAAATTPSSKSGATPAAGCANNLMIATARQPDGSRGSCWVVIQGRPARPRRPGVGHGRSGRPTVGAAASGEVLQAPPAGGRRQRRLGHQRAQEQHQRQRQEVFIRPNVASHRSFQALAGVAPPCRGPPLLDEDGGRSASSAGRPSSWRPLDGQHGGSRASFQALAGDRARVQDGAQRLRRRTLLRRRGRRRRPRRAASRRRLGCDRAARLRAALGMAPTCRRLRDSERGGDEGGGYRAGGAPGAMVRSARAVSLAAALRCSCRRFSDLFHVAAAAAVAVTTALVFLPDLHRPEGGPQRAAGPQDELDARGLQGVTGPVAVHLSGPFDNGTKGAMPKFDFALDTRTGTRARRPARSRTAGVNLRLEGRAYTLPDAASTTSWRWQAAWARRGRRAQRAGPEPTRRLRDARKEDAPSAAPWPSTSTARPTPSASRAT